MNEGGEGEGGREGEERGGDGRGQNKCEERKKGVMFSYCEDTPG